MEKKLGSFFKINIHTHIQLCYPNNNTEINVNIPETKLETFKELPVPLKMDIILLVIDDVVSISKCDVNTVALDGTFTSGFLVVPELEWMTFDTTVVFSFLECVDEYCTLLILSVFNVDLVSLFWDKLIVVDGNTTKKEGIVVKSVNDVIVEIYVFFGVERLDLMIKDKGITDVYFEALKSTEVVLIWVCTITLDVSQELAEDSIEIKLLNVGMISEVLKILVILPVVSNKGEELDDSIWFV